MAEPEAPAATTALARISTDTMSRLRIIAAARRESIAETVDRLAGEAIQADYDAIISAAHGAMKARSKS